MQVRYRPPRSSCIILLSFILKVYSFRAPHVVKVGREKRVTYLVSLVIVTMDLFLAVLLPVGLEESVERL